MRFLLNSRQFNDRRMGSDVDGEILGSEFKGYTLRITGGNDKQGFTMKQGILVNGRVRILMTGSKCNPQMPILHSHAQPVRVTAFWHLLTTLLSSSLNNNNTPNSLIPINRRALSF